MNILRYDRLRQKIVASGGSVYGEDEKRGSMALGGCCVRKISFICHPFFDEGLLCKESKFAMLICGIVACVVCCFIFSACLCSCFIKKIGEDGRYGRYDTIFSFVLLSDVPR